MKFDHIGVVVTDLSAGRRLLEGSIGIREWTDEYKDPINGVYVQFGRCASGVCYELVAPLSEESPVWSALSRKINVINHVAYLVDNIAREALRLSVLGFVPIADAKPAIAYAGSPIQFFVSAARFMIELIQAPDHQHVFRQKAAIAAR